MRSLVCDRRRFMTATAGLTLAGLVAQPTHADRFSWKPDGPVRIVVPFAAGGAADTLARILADELLDTLGHPVYVENVTGQGPRTGILHFLATADGTNSLLFGHSGTHGAAKAVLGDVGYDPETDFAPVGMIAETPGVLIARRGLARDFTDLVAVLRDKGSAIKIAHAGLGSGGYTGALALASELNISPTFVTYSGSGPALNDLISGQVDVMIDLVVNVTHAVAMHRIDAYIVAGGKRSNVLPDVPSAREIGMHFPIEVWSALFAARGTPPEQIQALNTAVRTTLDQPRYRNRLIDLGAEVPADNRRTPEALALIVRSEVERWKAAGLRGGLL